MPDVIDWRYTGNRFHPTQKPVGSLMQIIEAFCPTGGTVLDPFCDSGSTLIAATKLGRGYVGIELDAGYHQTATTRLSSLTVGGEAGWPQGRGRRLAPSPHVADPWTISLFKYPAESARGAKPLALPKGRRTGHASRCLTAVGDELPVVERGDCPQKANQLGSQMKSSEIVNSVGIHLASVRRTPPRWPAIAPPTPLNAALLD